MQYKNSKKLLIDQRKLESLFRLGCPDKQIIDLLKTGTFASTGDSLIDDMLESLIDYRVFENWGGTRTGAGRKSKKSAKKNQLENQDDNQDEKQLANQDANHLACQVVDKDIDKDIEYNFNIFWNNYIPVRITDGRIVNKGSRKDAFAKYTRIIKSGEKPENILQGLVAYLKNCQQNNIMTCGATVFLNQERWKNEYNTPTIIAQPHRQPTQKELKDFEYEQKKAALLAEIEKRTTK